MLNFLQEREAASSKNLSAPKESDSKPIAIESMAGLEKSLIDRSRKVRSGKL